MLTKHVNSLIHIFIISSQTHKLETAALVKLETLYGPNMQDPIYIHRKLAYMVKEVVDHDVIIRDLLCVLLIFKAKEEVSCPEFIR